eukprot:gnl/TRDRNA2_/TRDRNA2_28193_c0_seq1.p1 gnl/TRDRNA2_/TRDRNA2_28193_c0~~gnl/TRDRNA2_/TRDRNA2_28193_c0_seq1.p1  ORF type:complete len:314 (-),score=44.84 gnl/TRDRNA2_/TRDRNA2_28193_c0_seq1:163-1104(-)
MWSLLVAASVLVTGACGQLLNVYDEPLKRCGDPKDKIPGFYCSWNTVTVKAGKRPVCISSLPEDWNERLFSSHVHVKTGPQCMSIFAYAKYLVYADDDDYSDVPIFCHAIPSGLIQSEWDEDAGGAFDQAIERICRHCMWQANTKKAKGTLETKCEARAAAATPKKLEANQNEERMRKLQELERYWEATLDAEAATEKAMEQVIKDDVPPTAAAAVAAQLPMPFSSSFSSGLPRQPVTPKIVPRIAPKPLKPSRGFQAVRYYAQLSFESVSLSSGFAVAAAVLLACGMVTSAVIRINRRARTASEEPFLRAQS